MSFQTILLMHLGGLHLHLRDRSCPWTLEDSPTLWGMDKRILISYEYSYRYSYDFGDLLYNTQDQRYTETHVRPLRWATVLLPTLPLYQHTRPRVCIYKTTAAHEVRGKNLNWFNLFKRIPAVGKS